MPIKICYSSTFYHPIVDLLPKRAENRSVDFASDINICVIGLGYVGLPLAHLFATRYRTIGFDQNPDRVAAIMAGHDATGEVEDSLLQSALQKGFYCTSHWEEIRPSNFYIVAVPTPVNAQNEPDLTALQTASATVGKVLSPGDIVVYESTVYPGLTEEICIPILEKNSGQQLNKDFFVGYSPERINPGDKIHTVEHIKKITSGSTPETAAKINAVYASVITAGTYLAPSIKVAEAAKVIENTQRDINIAFVNELSKIFHHLGIDTQDVLDAAATKWNFLPFKPGLVGGHCVGVDPYYLAQCACRHGYTPEIILAGRRMNNSMGPYVADRVLTLMLQKNIPLCKAKVLILGFSFKENCSDVRNTKVIDIIHKLQKQQVEVTLCDPLANPDIVRQTYGLEIISSLPAIADDIQTSKSDSRYDAIILAVAHHCFKKWNLRQYLKKESVLFDVKGVLPPPVDGRL